MRSEPVPPTSDLVVEELQRVESDLVEVLTNVTPDELRFRPGGTGNPVGWLAWHIAV